MYTRVEMHRTTNLPILADSKRPVRSYSGGIGYHQSSVRTNAKTWRMRKAAAAAPSSLGASWNWDQNVSQGLRYLDNLEITYPAHRLDTSEDQASQDDGNEDVNPKPGQESGEKRLKITSKKFT